MKGSDLSERLLRYAVRVLRVSEALPRTRAARHASTQMFRAASSAGANYEEARGAESRADFVHKIRVACKEVRESSHWLRIVAAADWLTKLDDLIDESWQLIAILEASAKTARAC